MRLFKLLDRHWFWFLGIFFSILILIQPVSLAQTVKDWASPRQQNSGWISDRADLIPWHTEYHLNRRINKLAGRTGAELAIATLPKLETEQTVHKFALDLFNRWGIGNRDANNGVLLFVSKVDRRIEIITGKGLSDILPNAEVSRLIQQELVPAFQQQDYATGLIQGTTAISQRLETRLPKTISSNGIPWIVAIVGLGAAIFGSIQSIAFSLSRVRVPVPTQGIDEKTFANSSDQLAAYPFPKLLATLFTPNDRDWHQEIPEKSLLYVWIGGVVFGIGLILGFWQLVLLHPEAEIWQGDAVAWAVCAFASSAWVGMGCIVTSRFLTGNRLRQIILLELLLIAVAAFSGGYFWVYQIPVWWKLTLSMVSFFIIGWLVWRVIVGDDLHFRRQREYCSDRSGKPIQELTDQELESVLSSDENLARSTGKLEFRGWREAELSLPLTREMVYLVRRHERSAWTCKQCGSFAVDSFRRSAERTIEKTKKINRKQKEIITSVIKVNQTVYTCRSCGFVDAYDDQQNIPAVVSDDSSHYSSDNSDDSYSNSNDDYMNNYDSTYSDDYGSSPSNDFGGGSSDGSGGGSDW